MSILNILLPNYQKECMTPFDVIVKNEVNADFCVV